MARKKTNDEFLVEVMNLVGSSYIPLTPYNGNKKKVAFFHVDCGQVFCMSPNSFLRGQRCSRCSKIRRAVKQTWSNNKFLLELYKVTDTIKPLEEYVKSGISIKFKCLVCGYGSNGEWSATPNNILSGMGCPKCAGSIVTDKDFKDRVKNSHNNQFYFKKSYQGNDKKITCHCKLCGYEWGITPHAFYMIKGCPNCQTNHIYTTEEYQHKLDHVYHGEYRIMDEYSSKKTYQEIYHAKCGNTFPARAADLLIENTGCPFCNESKGEKKVGAILDNLGISYVRQKRFKNCKFKRTLPFDFYLPKQQIAIEYDGIQHTQTGHFKQDQGDFAMAHLRDSIKNWYCRSHHIMLIRIPYTAKSEKQIASYLYMIK